MKNEAQRRRGSKGGGLSMFFDMDTLKRRNGKSSNGSVPQLFVTMSPELSKRTKSLSWSRQRRIKIAIMGKSGVGKSALVVRFLTKRYIGEYSHVETHASTEVDIDEEKVLVEIFDTCTSEEKILDHINWADGFILVFSITDYWSLYEVARLSNIIAQTKNEEKIPIVVLSNQADMEKQRRISRAEATQFLNDLGKPVFCTSAADNYDSVRNAFEEASRMVYKWKFPPSKPRSRSGSIMDPLREAFTRLSPTTSVEEIRKRQRPRSVSIDVRGVRTLAQMDNEKKITNGRDKNSNSIKFLGIPETGSDYGTACIRGRSHSFA